MEGADGWPAGSVVPDWLAGRMSQAWQSARSEMHLAIQSVWDDLEGLGGGGQHAMTQTGSTVPGRQRCSACCTPATCSAIGDSESMRVDDLCTPPPPKRQAYEQVDVDVPPPLRDEGFDWVDTHECEAPHEEFVVTAPAQGIDACVISMYFDANDSATWVVLDRPQDRVR